MDSDRLRERFVTHQAINTSQTEAREESNPTGDESPETIVERRYRSIQGIRNRLAAVARQSIRDPGENGGLGVGSFDTLVCVTAYHIDCGGTYAIEEFLDRSGYEGGGEDNPRSGASVTSVGL